jgi:preprotein translocase subunit SecG
MSALIMLLMFLTSLFLIMLVLVQRGRGGGLAGALGGMGGQSAFGTKAGDLFTRITIGVATAWILLCIVAVEYYNQEDSFRNVGSAAASRNAPAQTAGGGKSLGEQPVTNGAPVSPLTNETPSENKASGGEKPASSEKPAGSAPAAPTKK